MLLRYFFQIDSICKRANLAFISDGYVYLHPPNKTLMIMESILNTLFVSRPLDQLYSQKSISSNKLYLVKCTALGTWSRAIIKDFIFIDKKVSYGVH